jgi:hypothetical protein
MALRREHECRLGLLLALQRPQGPQFIAKDRVRAGSALLGPADVQGGGVEVYLAIVTIAVAMLWPIRGTTPGLCRPISATATSSTQCVIRSWRLLGSKDFWRD